MNYKTLEVQGIAGNDSYGVLPGEEYSVVIS